MCESGCMAELQTKRAADSAKVRILGYGACAIAGCLWGTGFYFGKLALMEMGVSHMVLYRFLFASIGFLPIVLLHPARLNRSEWRVLLIASFLGIPVQFLVQFYGLSLTTVSHASLMVGTMPVILAAGAVLFAGERLEPLGWLALAGSTVGAALIVLGGRHAPGGAWTQPHRRSAHRSVTGSGAGMGSAQQTAHEDTFTAGGDCLWHSERHGNADRDRDYPQRPATGAQRKYAGVAGAGCKRISLHGNYDPPMELGHPSCTRFSRRSLSEH